ncbi:MAG: F0F1 ATP synthase subunit delta [Candidatus Liptonbacteria bacterium]|nr:F0F1 ATP synthase subunit delta [Candidatus Liptonbacteria bacterium]
MRYSPRIYAEAFSLAVAGAKTEEARERALAGLVEVAEKNGDGKKLNTIALMVEQIFEKRFGLKNFVIESAFPLKGPGAEFRDKLAKEGGIVKEVVRPSLLAGIKVTMNSCLEFDASLKRKLDQLF